MMQAAQLAAEAAMAEAAREASSGGGGSRSAESLHQEQHQSHHSSSMDMDASDQNLGMDPEQLAFLKAMQAAEMGDQANMMHDLGMMGIGSASNDSVESLLQMLAQQEQENQRPEEHYLTIAQNGKRKTMQCPRMSPTGSSIMTVFLIFNLVLIHSCRYDP
jgi:hypothetical protein